MDKQDARAILKNCDLVSDLLKSLAHPVRLKILCRLIEGESSVNELTKFCEVSQSAMSQFLKRMKEEGVLISRRDHNFIFYQISDPKLVELLRSIKKIYCS